MRVYLCFPNRDLQSCSQSCSHCSDCATAAGDDHLGQEVGNEMRERKQCCFSLHNHFRKCHRSCVPCVLTHPLSNFLFEILEIGALKRLDTIAMTLWQFLEIINKFYRQDVRCPRTQRTLDTCGPTPKFKSRAGTSFAIQNYGW